VYLAQPEDRQNAWEGEQPGTARGVKKPDAIIGDTAVEVGGESYSSSKLAALVGWCADRRMGIELY
jgi:hypothetical protein